MRKHVCIGTTTADDSRGSELLYLITLFDVFFGVIILCIGPVSIYSCVWQVGTNAIQPMKPESWGLAVVQAILKGNLFSADVPMD